MQGLIRNIDKQRRVIIPKEALLAAQIEPGDLLGIYADQGPDGTPIIVIAKYEAGCTLCGEPFNDNETVLTLYEKSICETCQSEIENLNLKRKEDKNG